MSAAKPRWTVGDAVGMLLAVPLMFGTTSLRGWAIVKLWGWFVLPVFGIPTPTLLMAIGLSTLSGMVLARLSDAMPSREEQEDSLLVRILRGAFFGVLVSLSSVGIGALLNWWAH